MKILVLGGTQFIGRHVIEKLLAANHSVTLLNRGKTSPGLFRELPLIQADREAPDFASIPELQQDWDAVVDLSAYFPHSLEAVLKNLRGRIGRYVLCSSLSAYAASSADGPTPLIQEDSPLHTCSDKEARDTGMGTYGQRKAECERVVMKQSAAGLPVTILRPCLVFGAHDHTDRMGYWIWRASREGKAGMPFILPDDGLTITRRTYAPDLATAFVSLLNCEATVGQAYNIAETDPLSIRDTLHWVGKYLGTQPLADAISVSSERLLLEKVKPWQDLPLWIPRTNLLVDTFKSRRDLGIIGTPAAQALAEAADAFLAEKREPRAGMSRGAELELIAKLGVASRS